MPRRGGSRCRRSWKRTTWPGRTAATSRSTGVSFAVEEGEVFGLLGPNGAGKTTTISMLTGVLAPTPARPRIGGHDILRRADEVKRINGLVPQDLALYPTLSARANLQFFGRIYGLRGKELRERVDDVLEIVALTDRADEAIEKYSGGMKRRVNIAAGLVHQPRLLFLDEPTVGVDPQSRNHIFESVQRLNRERQHEHHLHEPLHGGGGAPLQPRGDRRPGPDHRARHHPQPHRHAGWRRDPDRPRDVRRRDAGGHPGAAGGGQRRPRRAGGPGRRARGLDVRGRAGAGAGRSSPPSRRPRAPAAGRCS